jgi:hypothetical protein
MSKKYQAFLRIIYILLSLCHSSCILGNNNLTPYKSTTLPQNQKPSNPPLSYTRPSLPTYKRTKSPSAYKTPSLPADKAPSRPSRYKPDPYIAENGSYCGEISKRTNRPKNIYVQGYYRKDGKYVRGHYKSKRR